MDNIVSILQGLGENNTKVLLIRSHGSVLKKRDGSQVAVWVTSTDDEDANSQEYMEEKDEYHIVHTYDLFNHADKCAITTEFMDKYMSEVDGGMFISIACESGVEAYGGPALAEKKGFDAYAGPNGSWWTTYGDRYVGRLLEYMSGNVDGTCYSLGDADEKTYGELGKDIYGLTLVTYGDISFSLDETEAETEATEATEAGMFAGKYIVQFNAMKILAGETDITVIPVEDLSDADCNALKSELESSGVIDSVKVKKCTNRLKKNLQKGKIPYYTEAFAYDEPETISSFKEWRYWAKYYMSELGKIIFGKTTVYVNGSDEIATLFQ